MATTSFKPRVAKADPALRPNPRPWTTAVLPGERGDTDSKAVAVREDRAPALANGDQAFAGAWDRDDIRLPRINLVHKTQIRTDQKVRHGGFCFTRK